MNLPTLPRVAGEREETNFLPEEAREERSNPDSKSRPRL